jgi:hypothetical protein
MGTPAMNPAIAFMFLLLAALRANAATTVYSNNFEKEVGKEWSATTTEGTPKNGRHFLGRFTTHTVSLTLDKLPTHQYLRVSFELFVIMSWDGNGTVAPAGYTIGPDGFRCAVENGPTLVDATFSNMDFASSPVSGAARSQSYPSILPGENNPAKTGAAESNTLGYEWSDGGTVHPMDSVYKLSFLIPHEKSDIKLYFLGTQRLAMNEDECWGLANVKIEALSDAEVKRLDDRQMRMMWESIGGHDPVAEADAFWRLAAERDYFVRFVRGRIKAPGVDRNRFAQLVASLDTDNYQERERATSALIGMGAPIEGLLRTAIDKAEYAETKSRLESALKAVSQITPVDPEVRRYVIAMKLLKMIGTKEAEKFADEITAK